MEEGIGSSEQTIAWFDFGERLGIMDFADEQYFSWVRAMRLLVRGDPARSTTARCDTWSRDTPISSRSRAMTRARPATSRGRGSTGITCGAECDLGTRSPARLSDDEIAVATSLARMQRGSTAGPTSAPWPMASTTTTSG